MGGPRGAPGLTVAFQPGGTERGAKCHILPQWMLFLFFSIKRPLFWFGLACFASVMNLAGQVQGLGGAMRQLSICT